MYLNKLINLKDLEIIKIITGVRRCGKSTLLNTIFYRHLLENGVDEKHVIRLNLEQLAYSEMDYKQLYANISNQIIGSGRYYLFLDEIQEIDDYDKLVNVLMLEHDVDIYLTGSNSKLLSREISTYLSGRFIEIPMLPLTFTEYAGAFSVTADPKKLLMEYLKYEGFPFTVGLTEETKDMFFQGVYYSVLMKDVVERYSIRDINLLTNLVLEVFSSIGSLTSPNKLSNTLISKGYKGTNVSIRNYLEYLTSSFIVYKCNRYSIKGKKYFENSAKYYTVDLGLRNSILNYRQVEISHLLENAIFLELLGKGYKVDVGDCDGTEVDFVCRKQGRIIYLQVAQTLIGTGKLEHESVSLLRIQDNFEKYIITLDDVLFETLDNGIRVKNVVNFLRDDI